MSEWRAVWDTQAEMDFIPRLSPDALAKYAQIVLHGRRRWDDTVNVGLVCELIRNRLAVDGD